MYKTSMSVNNPSPINVAEPPKEKTAEAVKIVADQNIEELQQVLRCNFQTPSNVPCPKLKQIRIFLCSTHSDFKEEREIFWFEILPELQQHCLQYGCDILLYDPYQGTDADPTYEPHLAQNLLRQIEQCRSESECVFFVCLVGDKYGPIPLPVSVRVEEFQHIRTAAFEAGKDVKSLEQWYKLNENENPPSYEFHPDSSNKNLDIAVFNKLQDTLQHGAHSAHQDGLINQVNTKLQERYFTSFVEQAIQCAVDGSKHHQSNCLFVLRKLDGVQKTSASDDFGVYFDDSEGVENTLFSIKDKLSTLKNSLSDGVNKANVEYFRISYQTTDAAVVRRAQSFKKYLIRFREKIIDKLKHLIDAAYKNGIQWKHANVDSIKVLQEHCLIRTVYEDALHFYRECMSSRPKKYVGNVELLRKLRDSCRESQRKSISPIIVQGEEGSGKTALVCEVASVVRNWLGQDITVVVRFVSLVGTSNFAHETLRSICMQICVAHALDDLIFKYKDLYDVDRMVEWFEITCKECAKKSGRSLVIIIDDVHLLKCGQLLNGSAATSERSLKWIPAHLPQNVLIITTVTGQFSLDKMPFQKVDNKYVFQMSIAAGTTDSDLLEIAKNEILDGQKSVTPDQLGAIKQALKSCPVPIYAVFLGHEARRWSSHRTFNGKGLPGSLAAYLDYKLTSMEKQFSPEVVSTLCSYLECATCGLTETETFDLMSCNRDIMQNILEQCSTNVCRLPCSLWINFKQEMEQFLCQKMLRGKLVFVWFNSVISLAIRNRYLNNLQHLKKFHCDFADLFSDLWFTREQSSERAIAGKLSNKFVMPQPLHSTDTEGNLVYNYRRVVNLWFHVLNSSTVGYFEEQCLCNFNYLTALINSTGLTRTLSIFEEMSAQILNSNLHVLFNMALKPALESLSISTYLFPGEIIGRLRYLRNKNTAALNTLVDEAMAWVDNYSSSPLIVPLTCWISPPVRPLVTSFLVQNWTAGSVTLVRPTLTYQHVLVTGASTGLILMYHVPSSSLVKTFVGNTSRVQCLETSHNGQFFISAAGDNVRLWEYQQASCIKTLTPHNKQVVCALISDDDQFLITGSLDLSAKVTELDSGRIVRTFNCKSGVVRTLALSSHSEYLITGSDFTVIVWSIEGGDIVSQFSGLMAPISHLVLTSNDTFLLVACDDETLKVFSLCRSLDLHELRGHEGKIKSLAIANDDCQAFAGNSDGNVYCYDLHSGQLLSIHKSSDVPVTSLAVTRDGNFLISGSAENVHVWHVERTVDYRRQEDGKNLSIVSMSKDFKYAAAGNFGGAVYLWDLELCHCLWISQDDPPSRITYLQFDIEVTVLLSGALDGSIIVWSMANGTIMRKYRGHQVAIRTVQFFFDRSRLLSHDISGLVKIWDLGQDEEDTETEIHFKGTGDMLRLLSDGEVLAKVADAEKEIRVWNFAHPEGIIVRAKMTHNDSITCIHMSSNLKYVVTGSKDETLKVWEAASGYLTQVLVGHKESVVCCAASEDLDIVVSAASDNSVYAWEVDTGTIMSAFTVPCSSTVTAIAITPYGAIGIIGYKDGWIHAWSTESGSKIASFDAHLPVCDIFTTLESHRLLLRLEQCPHLCVACLHNSPRLGETIASRKRKRSRTMSTSSSIRDSSAKGGTTTTNVTNISTGSTASPVSSPSSQRRISQSLLKNEKSSTTDKRKPAKVFAPIERKQSRMTLFDSPTQTTKLAERSSGDKLKPAVANQNNNSSKFCILL